MSNSNSGDIDGEDKNYKKMVKSTAWGYRYPKTMLAADVRGTRLGMLMTTDYRVGNKEMWRRRSRGEKMSELNNN